MKQVRVKRMRGDDGRGRRRVRVCPTWTRRFLNSTSMFFVIVVVTVAVVRVLAVYR